MDISVRDAQAPSRNLGLDAVRAIAIITVLFAHGAKFFSTFLLKLDVDFFWAFGVVGVELFYALSGFLIGTIMLEIQERGPSFLILRNFVLRRWLRTLPLYYFVLLALLFVPALDPAERHHLRSYFTLSQNLLSPMNGIWFGPSWSLVIEEWSYLLLPFLAFGLLRRARHPVLISALLLCIAGIAVRLFFSHATMPWDDAIRKVGIMRIDAIAYGVLAAWLSRYCQAEKLKTWLIRLAPLNALLVLTGFTICAVRPFYPALIQGGYGRVLMFTTMGIGFAGLVLLAPEWKVGKKFEKPVRSVSKLSYAMYFVHWPFLFILEGVPSAFRLTLFVLGTLSVSLLLSRLVEQPMMRRRPKQFA